MGLVANKFLAILLKLIFYPILLLIDALNNVRHWYFEDSYVSDLSKKAVLITGCDSGFGAGAAIRFASESVPVFAGCLTQAGVDSLTGQSANLRPFIVDITKEESMSHAKKFVEETCAKEGWIFWGLVSNAGIAHEPVTGDWFTYEDYHKVIDVNLLGHIRTVVAFLPAIKKSGGRISVTSSVAGHLAPSRLGPYAASKFGVRGFAESLRVGIRSSGVNIAVVAPEFYNTNIMQSVTVELVKDKWATLSDDMKKEYPLNQEVAKVEKMQEKVREAAGKNNLSDVVDVYFHAIFNNSPRLNYFVGRNTPLYELLKVFPDAFGEWFGTRIAE